MKKVLPAIYLLLTGLFFTSMVFGQGENKSGSSFDSSKIYALALDGNIRAVLRSIRNDSSSLSEQSAKLKYCFEQRFAYDKDKTVYPKLVSPINELVDLYKNYWRVSVLNPDSNYDEMLGKNLITFLAAHYTSAQYLTTLSNRDSIGEYLNQFLKAYLDSFQLHTTGFGRTGKLIDLLVWKKQTDTVYSFKTTKDQINVPVTMMTDFITLGWEEYATLGKYFPGGWTTTASLFCVKESYDLSSEDFLISYLAHEGRHFEDYKLFPKLKSPDLEYRAKLVELSLAKKTLNGTIDFFITNANGHSDNGHAFADYCVIRDMSKALFKKDFVKDKSAWHTLDPAKINKTADQLLQENTNALKLKGKNVERFIVY